MIKKIGVCLIAFTAIVVAVGLLNRLHPAMGLGDVLYFVAGGVVMSVAFAKPDKKEP